MRWGMVIDLTKCTGCYACVTACQQEHLIPPGIFLNRLMISEEGIYPTLSIRVYPVLCNHCKETICVKVCPTSATKQRKDGIVWIDGDKCVGCRYCIVACPYQARSYVPPRKVSLTLTEGSTEIGNLDKEEYPRQTRVAVKCNYCMEKIDSGIARGLKPGKDRDATPACVNTCPTTARHFGDLDDLNSEVSKLIRKYCGERFHPEFGTDPSTWYIRG
jgi:phenylacetyl-CoA:acceptor oxidoreductase subunit 1